MNNEMTMITFTIPQRHVSYGSSHDDKHNEIWQMYSHGNGSIYVLSQGSALHFNCFYVVVCEAKLKVLGDVWIKIV